ncbi:hypothetical protein HF865_00580 [Lactobacillus reuteri]|uniref:Uncharacterized protein n=1 Tax=Limosilactobacillus reuteri TaxID=1598 RepID=A0AAW9ZI33_LIMRT|nr:hypothetical protein [Limosilactobacillus reuteri]NME21228.1 hypothetical protein [Limosilactobacillus reuteri]
MKYISDYIPQLCITAVLIAEIAFKASLEVVAGTITLFALSFWFSD